MVITVMSTTDDSESGESHHPDKLSRIKEKLKVQQRLIDISARNLQSTLLSSRSNSQQSSSSLQGGPANGFVSGLEVQYAIIEENLRQQENKLMRGFSRQLLLKHQHLKELPEEYDQEIIEDIRKQLDELISLEQFLNVTGIETKSIQALSSSSLSLDDLFMLSAQDLDQLFTTHDISIKDRMIITKYLEMLSSFYRNWERGENPSLSSYPLSRLNSLGSFDQDGVRTDSVSSCTSCGNSPRALRASTSNTPNPVTPNPMTPTSSYSLLSPATFTYLNSTPAGGYEFGSTSNPQTPNYMSNSQQYSKVLNRTHSSSSSVLLESPPQSLSQKHNSASDQQQGARVNTPRRKSALSHKRSLSNPPANMIINHGDETQNERLYINGTSSPNQYSGAWVSDHRSPSPPLRSGSHPSITSHSVSVSGVREGSPTSIPRSQHPLIKKISGINSYFSQSISNDQLTLSQKGEMKSSGSESLLNQQNTFTDAGADSYNRSNSLAVMTNPRRAMSSALMYPNETTSSSMVDLPVRILAMSSEHLDQIDEYGRPDSNKSRSVPRLTFMTVSMENEKGLPSTSAPTSPRTPGTYTPTGHMGHAIKHRFTTRTFISPHFCDYCKKTVMIGVRCKHCKYKCHKTCANNVPHTCGLPKELMDFFRKQVLLTSSPSPSVDSFMSPTETHFTRPRLQHGSTSAGSLDNDVAEPAEFVIQDLTKEPTSINFSPVMSGKQYHSPQENGRQRPELLNQTSFSSLLEVPNRVPNVFRSTSSSPSITPPTSPSPTPSSPHSPDNHPHTCRRSEYIRVVFTDESGDDSYEDHMTSGDSRSESPLSSRGGSINNISDIESPHGLRPPPQVVLAQSLPDLLSINSSDRKIYDSKDSMDRSNGYYSDDILDASERSVVRRKDSLAGTLSTADSKTSTLVNSNLTDEDFDYDSDGPDVDYRRPHRPSVVDEWSIPYSDIRIVDLVGRGPAADVFKGYWHGEVAIKRFLLPDATPDQIGKFIEEVSILKMTRHENLALFMGASLTAPNLAIVTSFCKGDTLYKKIHVWSEPFSLEKSLNIANQVTQAMGYLHARRIVHKNLNTKNIFLEKGKVVITDTGLSDLSNSIWIHQPKAMCKHQYVVIPQTKLYYLAPELIRVLSPYPDVQENGNLYPYSDKTDVYAFGTVLYELLIRKFPFSMDIYGFSMDPTSIVHLVGTGKKPDFQSRDVPRRVKDLLMDCLHFDPKKRLPFSTISEALHKLSRRKTPISRSPSFPTSLSRSSECLNF